MGAWRVLYGMVSGTGKTTERGYRVDVDMRMPVSTDDFGSRGCTCSVISFVLERACVTSISCHLAALLLCVPQVLFWLWVVCVPRHSFISWRDRLPFLVCLYQASFLRCCPFFIMMCVVSRVLSTVQCCTHRFVA